MTKFLSEMRSKILLSIIAAAFVAFAVFGLCACASETVTEEDLREQGWTVCVVYDYQGGTVNETTSTRILLKPNSKAPNPANNGNQMSLPVRSGYSFKNYRIALKDDNGEFLRDESGNYVAGDVWDFDTALPEGEYVLLAQWWDNYRFVLHYDNDQQTKVTSVSRDVNGNPTTLNTSAFLVTGYTFLNYYYDKEETNRIESIPIRNLTSEMFEASDDKMSYHVYGEGLNGTYAVIRQASDLGSFAMSSGSNIYFDADIDMNDFTGSFSFPTSYTGEIIGNNHTISNLKINVISQSTAATVFGLFGTVGATAQIKDVTFENVTYSVSFTNPNINQLYLGLLAGRVSAGAVIENVKISGSLSYELAAGFSDFDHVFVDDFIADDQTNGTIVNSETTDIVCTHSTVVDYGNYGVYVKYTESDGEIEVVGVYGIANKNGDSYSALRVNGTITEEDGVYTVPTSTANFKVTATVTDGRISVNVSI